VAVNNAAPCYSLGNYMSGQKFNQVADIMYKNRDCPKSADNNATTDPRFKLITEDIGMSYLEVLQEKNIDEILATTINFDREIL
jgi:hypothetical protein